MRRGQFHNYVASLENSPGFDAVGAVAFDRLVRREDLPQFEAQVRADTTLSESGYPDFAVFPPGDSEVLYVIDYVEPERATRGIYGFDIGSNPERRAAVEKARDTGALVATPGVEFLNGENGVLLFQPVYTGGADPVEIDERRERFAGVIAAGFQMDTLLAAVPVPPGAELTLVDAGAIDDITATSSILAGAGSSPADNAGRFNLENPIQVADRNWIVAVSELEAGFGDPSADVLSRILLALGLVIAVAVAIAGYVVMNSRQKATAKAWSATAHLVAQADELRTARDRALESDRLKTSFLANMSHELRTPLNAVIGLGGILANESAGPLNPKQLAYAETIAGSGGHLLELIDDLLDLARIEAGKEELSLVAVDIYEMLSESVDIVRPNFTNGTIQLVENPSEQPLTVEADERRLRQVVLNLLSNAVKFTPPGGQVVVEATRADGVAEITVRDTGIGIAPEDLEVIFTPFRQIEGDLSRKHGGTGLGLALSQRIVEMHGGGISVESELGTGSTFRIAIPVSSEADAAWLAVHQPDPTDEVPLTELARTVLIADDSPINLSLMVDLAEMNGLTVIRAKDGAEAVKLTRTQTPDLVLMDIQMPVMDGLEATRILKADPNTASIPILAVTALAMPEDVDRCLEAGCDSYLAKPFTPDQFKVALREALSQSEVVPV